MQSGIQAGSGQARNPAPLPGFAIDSAEAFGGPVMVSNSVGFNVLRTCGTYCPFHRFGVPHRRPNAHSRRP